MKPVDVIVLNWNGRDFLGPCLGSLRQQTYPSARVVVVDNASTDGSAAFVRERFSEVRVLELPSNLGFCGGNNAGIRATDAEHVALLNNDTEVGPDWLAGLVSALDRNPEAGMAASKMVFASDPRLIDTAGDLFFHYCGIASKRGHRCRDGPAFSTERLVFGACAGAALYRRSMLDAIGLLDESFFIYDEDVDLNFRAQLRGYKCVFVPQAVVRHHGAGTMGHASDRSIYLSKRNATWVVLKNVPWPLLLFFAAPMLSYHLASDVFWILKGRWRPVLEGRLDAVRELPRVLGERRDIQRSRRVTLRYLLSVLSPGLPGGASAGWA